MTAESSDEVSVKFPLVRLSSVVHLGSLCVFCFSLLFLCGVRLEHWSRGHIHSCQVSDQHAGDLTGLLV